MTTENQGDNNIILMAGVKNVHLESVYSTLKKAGYRRLITVDNVDCINQLITPTVPDLIILDDNFEGLRAVIEILQSKKPPELPVIFMGSAGNLPGGRKLNNIIDEVLSKPPNALEITARVHSLLETRNIQLQLQQCRSSEKCELKENHETYGSRENIKPKILIVEDSKLQSMIMCKNLGPEKFEILTARDGYHALETAHETKPDLIILDVVLPGMDGFSVCEKLKSSPATVNIPVLMITSLESMSNKLKGLECGADDYLIKPIDKRELQVRVNSLLKKKRLHDQLVANYNQLLERSIRDGLTGLYNYGYFQEQLNSEINRARRYKRQFSLLILDVDYFKVYNDTNGHPAGDNVLRELAGILLSNSRNTDLVARYGGEEFVIMLPETGKEGAAAVAEKIRRAVAEYPFKYQEKQPGGNLTVSIGVASFPEDASSAGELINKADQALYKAKKCGKNCYMLYGN